MDCDGDQMLSMEDLRKICSQIGLKLSQADLQVGYWLALQDTTNKLRSGCIIDNIAILSMAAFYPQAMLEEADRDGDGLISQQEFIQVMCRTNVFS